MEMLRTFLENIEKPMKIRWFFMYSSFLLFADCYMIVRFKLNLNAIKLDWIKTHMDLDEALLIILIYSLTFAVIIPTFGFLGRFIFGMIILKLRYDVLYRFFPKLMSDQNYYHQRTNKPDNFIRVEEIRKLAIIQNNLPAYNLAVEKQAELDDEDFKQYMCQTILFFIAIGYLFSSPSSPSLVEILYHWLQQPHFSRMILLLPIAALFFFFIGIIAFEGQGDDHGYVYFPEYNLLLKRAGNTHADD